MGGGVCAHGGESGREGDDVQEEVEKVKTCKCGRRYSDEDWKKLELVGLQDGGDDDVLELRNCVCNSTIAVELREGDPLIKRVHGHQ